MNSRSLNIALAILGIALAESANSQIYQFSSSLPAFSLLVESSSSYNTSLAPLIPLALEGNLTETVYIDAQASTIREVGSIVFSASTTWSNTIMETQQITLPPVFPNPPQTITLTGMETTVLSLDNSPVSFDTGTRPISWNGQQYTYNANVSISLPLSAHWSLVTGGETYEGSTNLNYGMFLFRGSDPWNSNQAAIDTSDYPNSINITPNLNVWGLGGHITSFTAANGFSENLNVVPEPTSLSLLALGAVALLGGCRMRRR